MIRSELVRIYGKKFSELCVFETRHGGWYYFSEPNKGADGELKVNPLIKPMQRKEMLALLEHLKTIQPKKKSFLRGKGGWRK